ncbi:hypothetical protein BT96DRAFT_1002653 [Gymnopus androsaceus JB14]|uniref:C2H2-type domain-containing protein n=1 Tax=Gymnopus androsaceus JB14 TaxID=1447944 RepID=A0A6A4GX78_9AGAR|nr:hypothetical protein BT96DRAFT_1002653 [Gymnopus androsaceus JB14]
MLLKCLHPNCDHTFASSGGHTKHWNSTHCEVTQEPEDMDNEKFTYSRHPYLTVLPTNQFSITLPENAPPPPPPIPDSSASGFKHALDMWAAQTLLAGGNTDSQLWWNAEHLYATIDNIEDINVVWQIFEMEYNNP